MIKYINKIMTLVMFVLTGVILVLKINNNDYSRVFSCISILIVVLIPFFLKKTNFSLEEKDKLVLNIFIFLAHFLGSIVNLYNLIWWYDLAMHYLSGIFMFLIAIFILKRLKKYEFKDILFNVLFVFGIIFMSASIWEILEFSSDIIFHTNLQHSLETGVNDTMEDMILAFLGGITTLVIYLINWRKKTSYE